MNWSRIERGAVTAAGVVAANKVEDMLAGMPQFGAIFANELGGPAAFAVLGAMLPAGRFTGALGRGMVVKAVMDVIGRYV